MSLPVPLTPELVLLLMQVMAALGILVYLCLAVRNRPAVGWVLIGAFIVSASDFPAPRNALMDASALALIFATLGRVGKALRSGGVPLIAALTLALIGTLNWALGVHEYGFTQATAESRPFVHVVVAGLWVLGQEGDEGFERRVRTWLAWTSWSLLAVAAWHIATRGLGRADLEMLSGSGLYVTTRPLVSGQAVVLAAAAIYFVFQEKRRLLPLLCVGAVLLSQHRSVWVSCVAAGLAVLCVVRIAEVRRRIATWAVAGMLLGTVLWLWGVGGEWVDDLAYSLQSRGTLTSRSEGWDVLVAKQNAQGWSIMTTGQPFGTGWARLVDGIYVPYSPHNWYVTIYLRLGILGIGAAATVALSALARQLMAGRALQVGLIVLIGVYAIPYNLPWYVAPILALGLARLGAFTTEGEDSGLDADDAERAAPLVSDGSDDGAGHAASGSPRRPFTAAGRLSSSGIVRW